MNPWDEDQEVAAPAPAAPAAEGFGLRPFKPGEKVDNADGSYSTERTVTVQGPDGQWSVVPSLWMGPNGPVDLLEKGDDVIANVAARYEAGSGEKFPRFADVKAAEDWAVQRSASGGASEASLAQDAPWEADVEAGERGPLEPVVDAGKALIGAHMKAGGDFLSGILSPETWGRAAEGMGNDLNSGVQGVNPIGMQEAATAGQAVGEVVKLPGMKPYVSVYDGSAFAPLSDFPADKFATTVVEGVTYVVPRTATDSAGESVEEGALASLGRIFGYAGGSSAPGSPAPAAITPKAAAAQDMAKAAEAQGVTPSFAMRGPTQSKIAAAGEQFFPTAGQFAGDTARVQGEISQAATRLADRAGPGASALEAGSALQRGGEAFKSEVSKVSRGLYDAVDQAIPPATAIQAPKTAAFLEGELAKHAGTPNIGASVGNTKWQGWLEDIKGGGLTWEAARALRTDIGEAVGNLTGPLADVGGGKLKALYAALSDDLGAAAAAQGPEAVKAWDRATAYTKASKSRIEEAFKGILGNGIHPERAYAQLTAMAQDGSSRANLSALSKLMRSLPQDDAAVVAGTVIRNLGKAKAGAQDAEGAAFSAETFLTNWNKLAPEAREIIAKSGLDSGVSDGLTQLAKVAERFRDAGGARNRSNTGNVASAVAFAGGLATAPVTTTATGIISHLSARALTNPEFLHAVNRAATGNMDALEMVAQSGGPLAVEAATLLRLAGQEASSPQSQPTTPAPAGRSPAP